MSTFVKTRRVALISLGIIGLGGLVVLTAASRAGRQVSGKLSKGEVNTICAEVRLQQLVAVRKELGNLTFSQMPKNLANYFGDHVIWVDRRTDGFSVVITQIYQRTNEGSYHFWPVFRSTNGWRVGAPCNITAPPSPEGK